MLTEKLYLTRHFPSLKILLKHDILKMRRNIPLGFWTKYSNKTYRDLGRHLGALWHAAKVKAVDVVHGGGRRR